MNLIKKFSLGFGVVIATFLVVFIIVFFGVRKIEKSYNQKLCILQL